MAMTADEFLTSRTDAQLQDALRRGAEQLRVIDQLEATEDFTPEGPFPMSKRYEEWSARDYANRRRQLNMAISDTEREIARRAAQPQPDHERMIMVGG